VSGRIRTALETLIDQGVTPEQPDPLKKRVRLTNTLSLFGALVMLASVPFDHLEAPRWMVIEDVIGGAAFLFFPLLSRAGYLTGTRLLCVLAANLIVLGNAVLLGRDSGAEMVFIALIAVPFSLFDFSERAPLLVAVLLPVACFAVASSGLLTGFRTPPEDYSAGAYYIYSATVTAAILLFALFQTSKANARAEQALRRDIVERLRAEEELEKTRQTSIYSAKMAALGEMSGNIAHEVNNPLAAILLRAQGLQRSVERGELDVAAVTRTAAEIQSTVHRIRRIVDSLRSFARDGETDPMRRESVRQIVADTVDLCAQRFAQHAIALHVTTIPEDLQVDCRAVQISQILLNLLSNAHDAVEHAAARRVEIAVEADATEIRIAVLDSGPGVAANLHHRIMEPFFTTKEIGKGTGLGLSVSKGIAEAHGGRLAYDTTSPRTRFVLALRRSAPV
jgi:signal transduction histidine kinase